MFNVRDFHFDIPQIVAHIHPPNGWRADTPAQQRRLLAKWTAHRTRLAAMPRKSPDEIQALQLSRIADIVDTAFITHPFYNALYKSVGYRCGDITGWSDYHALPTITKNDIIDNQEKFTARALSATECYSSRTSGSTGRTLKIMQDDATADIGMLYYLRHYEQLLGRERISNEWLYEIYLAPQRFSSLDGAYPIFTLSQDCPTDAALRHIRLLKPTLLYSFPSYLLRAMEELDDLTNIGIEAICTHSETSTRGERSRISKRFNVPVLDEYSSEELYLIATECRYGHYHIVEDNVRVDVAGGCEGHGEIVATSLVNTYMPFIKYRQGDLIELAHDTASCACGSRFRMLKSFSGRADQVLHNRFGKAVPSDRIMGLYDRTLLEQEANVYEFRVVQTSPSVIQVWIAPSPGATPSAKLIDEFVAGLRVLFNDTTLDCRVTFVDALPQGSSYKRRVICRSFEEQLK